MPAPPSDRPSPPAAATPRTGASATLWRIDTGTHGLLVAAAALALAACGGPSKAADTVPDARGAVIADVDIVGNEEVSDDEIIDGLATRPPRGLLGRDRARFDPLLAQIDLDRIEHYYKRRGFYAATARDFEVEPTGERVRVEFRVDEGEPSRIGELSFRGIPQPAEDDRRVRRITGQLERGEVLRYDRYDLVKRRLRQRLIRLGYAHAEVDGTIVVDREQSRADVQIDVDAGPRARFGRATIASDRFPESSVRARLAWRPNDYFDPRLIDQTEAALYGLGFFRTVRVEIPTEGDPATLEPRIAVERGEPREVRLGGGVAGDDALWELRARASYRQFGFLDPLTVLRLDLRPALTMLRSDQSRRGFGGEARAELTRYDLFAPLIRGELAATYELRELDPYSARGPGGRVGLGRPFWRGHLQLGAGWSIKQLTFTSISPAISDPLRMELGLTDGYRAAAFEQTAALDFRDNILDPHHGFFLELRAEEGGAYSASAFDFTRATAEARGYLPLDRRWVLAARAQYGRMLSGDLPITRRYFAGGGSSHRGFGHRRLAPNARSEDGRAAPIGGEESLVSSLEVRWDAFTFREGWVGIVAFADAGDVVFETGELDLSPTALHWASGLGLRYETLVGPLRIDVARRLNRTGPGNPDPGNVWSFHLSVGEAF